MGNQQEQKKTKRRSKESIRKKDPTIRQEFPGADTTQKKIEAGIRNIKNEPPAAPGNTPAPPADSEPVEEKSEDIN
jgi:hypothetical protein